MGSVYQRWLDADLSIAVRDVVQYGEERWLPYTFTSANQVLSPPTFTATQDLSQGVNLTSIFLLNFQIGSSPSFEVNVQGSIPSATTIDEIVAAINAAAGFTFAKAILGNSTIQLTSPGVGPNFSITILPATVPAEDATQAILGINPVNLPAVFPLYPYIYTLPYTNVVSIPTIQDKVRNESYTVLWTEGINYAIDSTTGFIGFAVQPPSSMWARRTLIDEETPWNNFGWLLGVYQKNLPSYLSIIQGLWFAYWNGPTPENVQSALYLLFGLPAAREASVVTAVTATTIQTTSSSGLTRTYNIPSLLNAIVTVGQSVARFQPLVNGIEVYDNVNTPNFVTNMIGRPGIQAFLTQNATRGFGDTDETKALTLLLAHTFLPQISVNAFISTDINLANVLSFLRNIKPLTSAFYSQIINGTFSDDIVIGDNSGMAIRMDVTPNVDSNQTSLLPPTELLIYETVDNIPLDLDSDGFQCQESVTIQIYINGVLLSSSLVTQSGATITDDSGNPITGTSPSTI